MKKLGLGKRVLACAASAATLLTGTTALSGLTTLGSMAASAASYDNYAKLLQYSMYFYDGNMCGSDVGSASQFDWRDNCHGSDEVDGGFHDAGDHVKFGLPAGYTASTLGWGYYEFKDSYDALGQTAHLQALTDRFCDFFKASTKLSGDTVTSFCYQVGVGQADHDVWCSPESQNDQSLRTTYWTSDDASDIAAEYAAALAVNYINFGNAEDLKYAKALYNYSIKTNKANCPEAENFYRSYDYYDDQAWAAGWLYLATKDSTYSSFLDKFMNDTNAGKSGQSGCKWGVYSTMCWNNVSLGAAILQSEITGDAMDWAKVTTYLNGKCTSESTYYCESDWGSARYNTALQMAALATTKYSAKSGMDYSSWCKAQMGMILGNNPKNVNFVVGMDSNSAKYPHHRAASGYQSFDEMKGKTGYSSNGHTLVGALVGGPADSNFTYTDSVNDYQANEVALDYNAGLVGAAAGLYSIYKTGSVDSSIEGVSGSIVTTTKATTTTTNKPVTTTTTQATTKQNITTTTITTAAPSGGKTANITTGTQVGTDGDKQMYAEFAPNGAKTATLYYKVKTSDTNSSGAFGTWTGSWEQEDFDVTVGANGECKVSYNIPSNVGQTVKAMIFYPDASSVEIEKVVLDESSTPVTTTVATSGNTSGGGKNANITTGTQTGTAGDKQLYAEFAPNGAKTATLYYTISTKDTNSSGAFGTWTGSWEQTDFDVTVGANGQCKATYNIPSNVGQTVKAMVFYPDASSVKIDKVVLDEGSSSNPTTNATTTKQNPTTTATTAAASGDDKTANITTGTQTGTAGDKQLYAEFAPNGAKSATLYYTISTKDTNSSGAFGTWTGSWEQTDFDVTVGSNGQCTADYVIPSNVGQTVKAMVFYPDASSVKIDKVVLHYGNVTPGTTTAKPSSGGKYTKDLNQAIVYEDLPAGDKMLGWKWSDLGVPAGEKVTKVEINLSTSKKQIGKWQGAFGSSTSVAPDYWTQSEDMEQTISGKTGSIVWDVDSATSAIIQTQYGGELKFGVWWIDCNKFTIDSITVYTDAYNGSGQITTTVSTTKATTNKTTASTTTTTKQTTTATNGPKPSVKASLYGDVNLDGRVDITDAVLLNKKVAGVVILNDQQYANADCCTDDGVGQADSTVLLQFLVSIVRTLPAEG
ncbi:MAG: glycoside hydrolase family 9 protein [Ruminococcus callidus]|uniref:glycoside hydrolase family 9 protein n=1 Tax=Ruminococcus callidus TaxID=40519 RepID=UPI002E790CF9|nr:glycoside hydrolase family 9 protein [Ruminococcus callidus]MEE0506577.1 glycoside hydrolase family 9 protein [Ruminococcus callidus]